jgi:putative ABC transport system permease protein
VSVKFLPLIWANLWRKKPRTVFTFLSIMIAFLLFGLLQGVNAWLNGFGTGSHANRIYIVSRVSEIQPLPSAYLTQIERVPGIRRATYVGGIVATYQERGNEVFALAADAKALFAIYPEWQVAPQQLEALTHNRTGAIVGAQLMQTYGWKIGDRVPLRTAVMKQDGSADWAFDIVGVYSVPTAPDQANRLLINYDYLDEARLFERGTVYAFVADIDSPARSAQICAAIDTLFANSPDETLTQDENHYFQAQLRQIGNISLMLNAIVAAVLFTLLFLSANTMMQSVRERIPELAVLKTIGFSGPLVTTLILGESLLLCLLGALMGLAVAAAVFPVTATLGIAGTMPLKVVAAGLAIAVVLALASGLPPARRAQRLTIVDALAGR